jgi:uncharacterized protein (DUF1697 family)
MAKAGGKRVLLIRAVNVGGATLPMAELRELATDLGATDVATYIASGNLLCRPPGGSAEFDRALEQAIEARYGFSREVISRTPQELRAALTAHPFDIVETRYSYLYFLTGKPAAGVARAFEARVAAGDYGHDEARVIGSDLHVRYRDGAGKSRLDAKAIARALGVQGTGRNLDTVRKLIDLART